MRLLLSLLMSFQFVSTPLVAAVGEQQEFSAKRHLINTLAATEALEFEKDMRFILARAQNEGPVPLLKELRTTLHETDFAAAVQLLKKTTAIKPEFKEKSPGNWELKHDGHKISFSLMDLHKGEMWINGRVFKFKGVALGDLEKALSDYETPLKTTMLQMLFEKTFGVESAHALGPFILVVGVVAVAILGYSIWELKMKPEKTVKKINEMKSKLEAEANSCQEAGADSNNYNKTYELAYNVSDRTSLNSATSASNALEFALKEQLNAGARNDQDCFKLMHEAGKKVDLNIPVPTERQITMRELGGGAKANSATDVATAAFNLCSAYNALGACMGNFVAAHVDNSGVDSFKERAEQNFSRYQRRSGSIRQ